MAGRPARTPVRLRRAVSERYTRGEGVASIAQALGIGKGRLYRILAQSGTGRRGHPAHRDGTLARHARIHEYRDRHPEARLHEIAARFGLSVSRISAILGTPVH